PNVGSSPRRIHRRISGYVPADGTQVTEPQASKMWNYFFPGPLNVEPRTLLAFNRVTQGGQDTSKMTLEAISKLGF
ncbi:MAG: hypothetical protein WBM78_01890, partial [Desulfobacterales bacterium]